MQEQSDLRLNEWITPSHNKYSYQIYTPGEKIPDPLVAEVNVNLRLHDKDGTYFATFKTMGQIKAWFEEFKNSGHYASGTYIPEGLDIIVEEISNQIIERTIDDLLEQREINFPDYFIQG